MTQLKIFEASGEAHGAVLIVAAMGVDQSFYAPIARWLASQGYLTATFNYRTVGEPTSEIKHHSNLNVLDWAHDAEEALAALAKLAGQLPIFWIGHSLGGQLFGMIENQSRVARMISVASGSGYWLQNSWPLRWRVWFLWFFVVPIAIPIFGYFPGKKLKMVGDLPSQVMWQWRRWCLNRDYAVGVEGEFMRKSFARVTTPVTAISLTDDELLSEKNIRSLHSFYVNSPQKWLRLAPENFGLKKIQHFGFFRERMKENLWQQVLLPELKSL